MAKSFVENVKIVCEILAYAGAAGFFTFKAGSGFLYTSLSISIDCTKRFQLNKEQDQLIVSLSMTAGDNAVMNIHEVQGKYTVNGEEEIFTFDGIERLDIQVNKHMLEIQRPWKIYPKGHYRVNIKETTTFSKALTIPANALCKIEVAAAGSRVKWWTKTPGKSQWRASQFSIPLPLKTT